MRDVYPLLKRAPDTTVSAAKRTAGGAPGHLQADVCMSSMAHGYDRQNLEAASMCTKGEAVSKLCK